MQIIQRMNNLTIIINEDENNVRVSFDISYSGYLCKTEFRTVLCVIIFKYSLLKL